ncbi:MAG TPA: FtsX-like permease family protein [Actinomycetota bacterium]
MWKATFRGFLAHKFRLALTTLAVVLGVGFVTGTYVLTDTMNRAFDELFAEVTASTDVIVRAEADFISAADDRPLVPETLLDEVRAVEGVAVAEGEVSGFAQIVAPDGEPIGRMGPPTLGVSASRHPSFQVLTIREGRNPERDGEVAVDVTTAADGEIEVGDVVTVLFEGPPEEFEVVGIAGFGSADNLGGATLAVFDLRTAQRVLGAKGGFDAISIRAAQGVTARELQARVAGILPDETQAITAAEAGQEQAETIQEGLGFFRTALLVFAGVALFVGAFIIFNTFSILIAQRTRELGLLRALGASGAQVTRSVLAEAFLTGVVAAAIGLGFGVLVAAGLRALLEGFGIDLPSTSLQVLPRTIWAAAAVGIVITLVASVLPARRAAHVTPMEALRESDGVRPLGVGVRLVTGGVVVAIGVGLVMLGLLGDTGGLASVGGGVFATFLGVTTLSPLTARPLSRFLGAPLPRMSGVAGRLGRNNASRNPRRTASTSAALMIGLALVATFSVMGSSVKASVGALIEQSLRADFVLQSTTQFAGFSNTVAEELDAADEIAAAVPVVYAEFREPGSTMSQFLSAVDPARVEDVVGLGAEPGALERLATGEGVLIHESLAESTGVEPGEPMPMRFPAAGVRDLTVAGTFTQNGMLGERIISMETYEELYTSRLHSLVFVKTEPGDARAAIESVTDDFPNVEVLDQGELRAEQERQIDQLLGLINALLGLAILIALLGIVNTLALSVFERTRELGLLRAVGMSRRQTRRMIRWESVLIALIGGLLGLGIGLVFGTILVRALADEGITTLSIPGGQLVVFLFSAGIAGVVAAVGPARRAARLDVLAAISHE